MFTFSNQGNQDNNWQNLRRYLHVPILFLSTFPCLPSAVILMDSLAASNKANTDSLPTAVFILKYDPNNVV